MTTHTQLSTTEPKKKQKQKQTKQTTRTGTEAQRSPGDHLEGYHWGEEEGEWGRRYRE